MTRLRQELATTSLHFDASRAPLAAACRRALPLLATLLLAGATTAGCSGGAGKGLSPGNWFGSGSSTAKKPAKTLYTKTDGLQVHADHDGSSKTLGRLKAGEKVVRTQTSGAWSRIEARGGDLRGWVPSSQIGSRPSTAAAAPAGPDASASAPAAEPAATEAQVEAAEAEADARSAADPAQAEAEAEAGEEEAAQPTEAAATPAAAPAKAPADAGARPAKKGQVAPSVFDPY